MKVLTKACTLYNFFSQKDMSIRLYRQWWWKRVSLYWIVFNPPPSPTNIIFMWLKTVMFVPMWESSSTAIHNVYKLKSDISPKIVKNRVMCSFTPFRCVPPLKKTQNSIKTFFMNVTKLLQIAIKRNNAM